MKRALIITYYWPPAGGAGVYRWLKFTKHMHKFGWQPVIYTPSNPAVAATDRSLLNDVTKETEILKYPIFEPLDLYKFFNRKNLNIGAGLLTSKKTAGWKSKLLFWFRGNFFIPDPRKFWIKPSVKFLRNYLKHKPVDVIISTGPPHSMHLIALKLSQILDIKWVADFRDPWTNIDFYNQLKLTRIADKKNKRLEQKVLKSANIITTVSNSWATEFIHLGAGEVEVITNGFDQEEFSSSLKKTNTNFTITHIGSMNQDRNPAILWQTLAELLDEDPRLKDILEIKLIGDVDFRVFESVKSNGLSENLVHIPYMEHKKVIEVLQLSSVLLLPLNNTPNVLGIIPGKLFEYLAAKKPIIAIGPENGDTAVILNETKSGTTINYTDKEKLAATLKILYEKYKSGDIKQMTDDSKAEKYSRANLCKDFCVLLDKLTQNN
ncbi:MAG: glycosyltransferase [Bacteroidales bacterium]|nr:glycosyltransferase [Bacteroidales bacterium]